MSDVEKVKASVLKNLNVPGLMGDVLDEVLEPALKALVADTANKLDDILLAAIYPQLEAELKKLSKEYWEKVLAPAPAPAP